MILNKLSKVEAEKLTTERGFEVESDQNGVKRVVIDGFVIEVVGDFNYEHEAVDYAGEVNLPENNRKIAEVEVEVTE